MDKREQICWTVVTMFEPEKLFLYFGLGLLLEISWQTGFTEFLCFNICLWLGIKLSAFCCMRAGKWISDRILVANERACGIVGFFGRSAGVRSNTYHKLKCVEKAACEITVIRVRISIQTQAMRLDFNPTSSSSKLIFFTLAVIEHFVSLCIFIRSIDNHLFMSLPKASHHRFPSNYLSI